MSELRLFQRRVKSLMQDCHIGDTSCHFGVSAEKYLVGNQWGYRRPELTPYFSDGHLSAQFASRSILDVQDIPSECVGPADMCSSCLAPS